MKQLSEGSGTSGIGLKGKLGYGAGDFAANLVYQTVALYLIYYLTDVRLMDAALAGTFFFLSKIWDAVTDPVMGYLADRTRSRWGQYRPYLFWGSFPLGLSFFLLFFSPALSARGVNIYVLLTFIAFSTCYTIVNIPYSALTAKMTRNSHERSTLSGFRMAFAIGGTLCTAGATKPLVSLFPTELMGFQVIAAVYAVFCIGINLITFASVKESVSGPRPSGMSIRHDLKLVARNRPFILLTITTILQMCAVNLIAAMINFYFKYNLQAENLISIGFLCFFISAIVALPLWVRLSKGWGKKRIYICGMVLMGAVFLLLFVFTGAPMPVILCLFALGGVGMSTQYLCPWAMVADTVEYGQWKNGERREGILYGFFSFAYKFSAALSGMVAGIGLKAFRYVPNTTQSDFALRGINVMITLIPAFLILSGISIIVFYSINAETHQKIVKELNLSDEKAGD